MEVDFSQDVFEWRGPAPYCYVVVPDDEIKEAPPMLNHGWGVIPARVVVGDTEWATSEFPRTVATWCRSRTWSAGPERIGTGDVISVSMVLGGRPA